MWDIRREWNEMKVTLISNTSGIKVSPDKTMFSIAISYCLSLYMIWGSGTYFTCSTRAGISVILISFNNCGLKAALPLLSTHQNFINITTITQIIITPEYTLPVIPQMVVNGLYLLRYFLGSRIIRNCSNNTIRFTHQTINFGTIFLKGGTSYLIDKARAIFSGLIGFKISRLFQNTLDIVHNLKQSNQWTILPMKRL